jgi:hypothetical protein
MESKQRQKGTPHNLSIKKVMLTNSTRYITEYCTSSQSNWNSKTTGIKSFDTLHGNAKETPIL